MAGNGTVEACGNLFKNAKYNSNYGIDSKGNIAIYVSEDMRSVCTSNTANDNRAITIEVANDGGKPDWHVSDKALSALKDLLVDVCQRNGIKKLLWQNDKNLIGQVDKQNMTVHRWFAPKECPGSYLLDKHYEIAEDVNKRLEEENMTGEEIYNRLMEYLRSLPTSEYAKASCAKGVESGIFSDGDKDGLVDDPHAPLLRQEFATVLDRLGLLK